MVLWCIFIASIVQLSYCANVYYKLSSQSQDVFGPFAEQQVIGWLEQGYFDVTQVVISREHEDAFIPMGRYFSRESNYDHSSTIVNDDPSNAISYNPSDDQRYDGGEDRHVYYDDRNHQPSVEDYGYNPVGTIGRPSSGILSSLSRRASSLITSNTKGLLDITKIIRKKISHSASSVVGISSGSGMRGPYPLRRREDPSLMHRVDEEVDFDGRNENERGVMYSESDSPPQHQLGSKQFDNDYSVDDSDVDHADDGTVLHNPIDNSINQTSTNEELLTNRTQILLSETASKPEVIKPHTSFIDKGPLVWSMNEASVSSSSSSSLPKQSIISPNDPPPPLLLPTEHPSITHHDRFSVKSIGSHEYSTGWSDVGERPRKGGIMRSFLRGRSLSMSTTSSGLDRDGHNLWSSSSSDNNMHRWSVEAVIQLVKRLLERIIISLPQYVLSWFVRALIPTHVRRASSILYSIALPGGDATTTAAAAEGVDRRSNWLLLTHMVIYGAVRYVSTLLSIIALPMIVLLVRDAMGAVIIPSSTIAIEPIGAELHGLQTIRVIQHLHMDSLFHFIRYELSSITYYRTFFQQCFNSIQSIDLNEALSHAVIAWRYIQAQCISMLMGALDYLHSSINTIVSTPLLTQAGALIVGVMVIECLFIPYLTSEISSAHVSAAAISKQWSSDDYEDAPLVAVNANDDEPSEQLGSAGTMMAAPIVTYISSVCSSVCRLVAVTSSLLVVTSSLHSSISYSMGSTTLLLLTPYISIALLGTIHLYLLPIPTHRSSSSSSSSSTSDLPIPTTTLSTQEQLYADW